MFRRLLLHPKLLLLLLLPLDGRGLSATFATVHGPGIWVMSIRQQRVTTVTTVAMNTLDQFIPVADKVDLIVIH